jgi:tRNA A-37 threonylcarbamoyl transferase component Bud32
LAGGKELHEQYHPITVPLACGVYKFGVEFGNSFGKARDEVRRPLTKLRTRVVYLKEYFYRSWWDFVKHLFRRSRARRAMRAGLMLAENGFESPPVIAIGRRKFAFFTTRSFMVTLEVENTRSVYQIVRQARHRSREKRSFARALGRTVGRMHAEGIFHGDLRPGNVLARKERDGWRIFFLDNERTKRFRRLPKRLRLKNLVQINMFEPGEVSNTDRMRFFKEYWAENKKDEATRTALIKKVLEKTRRRLRKEVRLEEQPFL